MEDKIISTYAEYLKSETWKKLRQKAIDYAGGRCQVCNSPHDIEVHHRKYSSWGKEPLNDLTVLCHSCHKLVTKRVQRKIAFFSNEVKTFKPRKKKEEPKETQDQASLRKRLEEIRQKHEQIKPAIEITQTPQRLKLHLKGIPKWRRKASVINDFVTFKS